MFRRSSKGVYQNEELLSQPILHEMVLRMDEIEEDTEDVDDEGKPEG